MTGVQYCPKCGTARLGGARHCTGCGLDYWRLAQEGSVAAAEPSPASGAPGPPPPSAMQTSASMATASATGGQDASTVRLLGGVAWIISAAALGYLAFLQLQYSQQGYIDSADAGGLAVWNGISAAITIFFGARLITGTSRSFLMTSVLWATLSVVAGAYQISQGVTADVFILATLFSGVAGVLSFTAWWSLRRGA